MSKTVLVIHGGAGTLLKRDMTEAKEEAYREVLTAALEQGKKLLDNGHCALDAVEESVRVLEDSPLFNAGKGSVFTSQGKHEMDASIMNGLDRTAGSVCGVTGIKNPVSLARAVMERTEHVMLSGEGAESFAKEVNTELREPAYFHDQLRFDQWQKIKGSDEFKLDHDVDIDSKFGTVGAVALDSEGNLAAATSTGGMTNKRFGRIGDTPIIGSGTYASNATCAVSCTGSGEYFIRGVVAYDVSALVELSGRSLEDACNKVVHERLTALGGDGGLIALNTKGEHVMAFNTAGMYRGFITEEGRISTAIFS